MNKKILGIVLMVSVMIPGLSFASTGTVPRSVLQQILNQLVLEVQQLEQELVTLQANQTSVATPASSSYQEYASTPAPLASTTVVQEPTQQVQQAQLGSASAPTESGVVLTRQEANFVGYASSENLIRTDDPTNCPAISYATTTQNQANIEAYLNGVGILSVNGGSITPQSSAYPGEKITVVGNFLQAYCDEQPVGWIGSYALPPLESTTTYTFTFPTSSMFVGDVETILGMQFHGLGAQTK